MRDAIQAGGHAPPGLSRLTLALLIGVAAAGGLRPTGPAPVQTRAAVEIAPRDADERALAIELAADVWTEPIAAGEPVVVVLARDGIDALAARGVPHRIVVDDIDAVAADERLRLAGRVRGATAADWFAEYRDIDELAAKLEQLVADHPGRASVKTLGTSIDGQPIRALEVSRGGGIGIAVNGGQHAREWISVMVPICIADRLLAGNAGDPRIRRILDAVSFHIVPVVNPDGYRYSWEVDRYWRKNRRGGYGVDLNRNYSVAWGQGGSSDNRRSQNYRGEHAFSEPESQAMRTLFDTAAIAAHVDFHSFSQLVLYPWSHRRTEPPDRDKFAAIADRMVTAIYAAHGETYKIRPGSSLIGDISGTLGDWVYGERGALSFLIELRPAPGRGGFVLPPDQIVPTCDESLAAVLELAEWMIRDAERQR